MCTDTSADDQSIKTLIDPSEAYSPGILNVGHSKSCSYGRSVYAGQTEKQQIVSVL